MCAIFVVVVHHFRSKAKFCQIDASVLGRTTTTKPTSASCSLHKTPASISNTRIPPRHPCPVPQLTHATPIPLPSYPTSTCSQDRQNKCIAFQASNTPRHGMGTESSVCPNLQSTAHLYKLRRWNRRRGMHHARPTTVTPPSAFFPASHHILFVTKQGVFFLDHPSRVRRPLGRSDLVVERQNDDEPERPVGADGSEDQSGENVVVSVPIISNPAGSGRARRHECWKMERIMTGAARD